MNTQILQSDALKTVPPRKVSEELQKTVRECETCTTLDNLCDRCRTINVIKRRYANANIPISYWYLKMEDFKGPADLKKKYDIISSDLENTYDNGTCICFAGSHGIGKSMVVTNILKSALAKGYQCLYTTLGDVVATAVSNSADKYIARKELMMVDFLVIDEFDGRHMTAGAGADLFGRQLEDVFRRRAENNLPLFMCTNSPNVLDSFEGPIKKSIESLMSYAEIVPVLGKDYRKVKNG